MGRARELPNGRRVLLPWNGKFTYQIEQSLYYEIKSLNEPLNVAGLDKTGTLLEYHKRTFIHGLVVSSGYDVTLEEVHQIVGHGVEVETLTLDDINFVSSIDTVLDRPFSSELPITAKGVVELFEYLNPLISLEESYVGDLLLPKLIDKYLTTLDDVKEPLDRVVRATLCVALVLAGVDCGYQTALCVQAAIMIQSGLLPLFTSKSGVEKLLQGIERFVSDFDEESFVEAYISLYVDMLQSLSIPRSQVIKKSSIFE